ncbi:uncharacterized protein EAF01_009627 [Botrytis porri]|uniref:uncharacterized protein n=1 Tax=Botrytis porri TaxID=87229 RepID=UPI0018FF21D4|nr:uncharacterized protein EAF01_009627 [Botrytis porri]KAF7895665.1 hypothetical protein EAF01_009627 [Botrytis porri]
MPAVNFSEEHLLAYPDAKVVLTTRDPDKWIASVESSMYAIIHSRLLLPKALPFRQLFSPDSRIGLMATQKIALLSVQDSSLTMKISENLLREDFLSSLSPRMVGNLCAFLEKPVPETS